MFELFNSQSFGKKISSEWDGIIKNKRSNKEGYTSSLAPKSNRAATSTITQHFLNAVKQYLDGNGALLESREHCFGEYVSHNGSTQIVYYNKTSGAFMASVIEQDGIVRPYKYGDAGEGDSGAALIFTLIPVMKSIPETDGYLRQIESDYRNGNQMERLEQNLFQLCDFLYRATKASPQVIPSRELYADLLERLENGNVKDLVKKARVIYGEPKVFTENAGTAHHASAPAQTANCSNAELRGKYAITDSIGDDVPTVPDNFVIPEVLHKICQLTQGGGFRNFLLHGPAGTGKSRIAYAMASALGLSYNYINCSSFTDDTAFFGTILPHIGKKSETEAVEFPSWEDVEMDPASAYEMVTGIYDDTKNVADVFAAMSARAAGAECSAGFDFAESAFVKAFRDGGLIEIQEPTSIANAGVLVALNSAMDDTASITLPTKEQIRRHKDCVIVLTTNVDYNGCRGMNQSFISRCVKFPIEGLDLDEMVERTMANVALPESDRDTVRLLAECVEATAQVCQEYVIEDGSCGMRELINAAKVFAVLGDAREAAIIGIANGATLDKENRDLIIQNVIDPKFG